MRYWTVAAGAVALAACAGDRQPTQPLDVVLSAKIAASHGHGSGHHVFLNQLAGANEVPPRATPAHGTALVRLTERGPDALEYVLVANQIENVVASHIHVGAPNANGPVVAFLYGNAPPGGGPHNGLLATGRIVASDLVGPLAGATIADLVAQIRAGNAYVNVHTNDGVAPTNTGPGDFPGGEIRGQLEVKGN